MMQYFADIFQAVFSAFKGMGVTIKHIYRKPVTLQYPDERQVMPERFRGFVFNDMDKCDACLMCAKNCPVDCIYIEVEGKGKDRYMTRWAVDYNKCIWCSLCTENCRTGSISMSHDYDHSVYDRRSLVYEFMDPREGKIPCHNATRVELGWWVPPKPEKPKPKPKSEPKPEATADTPQKDAGPAAEAAPAAGHAADGPCDEDEPAPKPAPDGDAERKPAAGTQPAGGEPAAEPPAPPADADGGGDAGNDGDKGEDK